MQMTSRRPVRLMWDYLFAFEWGEEEPDRSTRTLEQVLPCNLVRRANSWGSKMTEAYASYEPGDPFPIVVENENELRSEYNSICREIESLGYDVQPKRPPWPFDY